MFWRRDGKVRNNIPVIVLKKVIKNGCGDLLRTVIVRDVKANNEYTRYIESEAIEIG